MSQFNYTEQAKNLGKAIDIAIKSIKKYPPKSWNHEHIAHVENVYMKFKNDTLHPEQKYKNSRSFAYIKNDVFTYFQEGSGEAVNYFWEKINEQQLPYKRENRILKILKRKKIKNDIEFNFVIDVIVPYKQEGLISEEEEILLNKLIGEFEERDQGKRNKPE